MKYYKKIIALVLSVLLLFTFSMTAFASPNVGDTCYLDTKTDCINSKTGTIYRAVYSMDYLTVRNDGTVCYCIEPGTVFTRTFYKAYTPTSNSTWCALSSAAREGVALSAMFGYPSVSAATLGTPTAHDAYAATQAVIWEYVKGERTNAAQPAGTTGKAIIGTPAEAAYWKILNKIKEYQADSRYKTGAENNSKLTVLTSASASTEQGCIFYTGTAPEYPQIQKGNICINKRDENGAGLAGAVYLVTNTATKENFRLGPTNDNGYAVLGQMDFGTYTLRESVFPTGYYGGKYPTEFTVTLNSSSPNNTVTVNAVNEQIPGSCKIVKTSEDGNVYGISFTVEGNGIRKNVTTDINGEIQIDGLKPGIYTVTEAETEKYVPQEVRNVTVVSGHTATVTFNNILKRGGLTVTKTSEDGLTEGIEFHLYGTSLSGLAVNEYAVTDSTGKAFFNDVLIGNGYTLEEVNTSEKYVVPASQQADILWNTVTEKSVYNILKKWKLTVTKSDSENITAQGNATLEGAVYGIFNSGKLVARYATDKNGQFITKEYVCGNDWTLSEITPSNGYLLNADSVKIIGAEPINYTAEHNAATLNVTENVIKGKISIIKHSDDGKTQIETPEVGAEFNIYLETAGSYDNAKPSERDILITDSDGYAETKLLPYGTYVVEQIRGKEGREMIKKFKVKIAENAKTYIYLINNAVFKSLVEIVKKDKETGNVIPVAGIGFKVKDLATGQFITQHINYPTPMDLDVFYTDNTGMLRMPEALGYGRYEIIEQTTADGYVLDQAPVEFVIDGSKATVTVEKYNMPQKGKIVITKAGEVFAAVTERNGFFIPVYEVKGLKGAEYTIIAAEDIITPDGTLRYAAGEIVDTVTTDETGKAESRELYLGKYEVIETKAPYGMVLNTEPKSVELEYDEQTVSVTEKSISFYNERQKVKISLQKILEQDESYKVGMNGEIKSVKFGLYADEDIVAEDGSYIPKDGLIDEAVCDKNGELTFDSDLPIDSKYYIKEISTDKHYILSDEKYSAYFEYYDQMCPVQEISVNDGEPIINRIIYGEIKGLKLDSENKNPISGAVFGLFKAGETEYSEGTAIITAISDENGEFRFINVPFGSYTVSEIKPADGYCQNDSLYEIDITEPEESVEITVLNERMPETPKTGDNSGVGLALKMLALSALAVTVITTLKKRKKDNGFS